MSRFLFVLPLIAIAQFLIAQVASAQSAHEHDACARDVARFCRAQMNDGDQVVLSCLQQNRGRISRACQKVLADHGQ
jgi:Cysteine rich repeat